MSTKRAASALVAQAKLAESKGRVRVDNDPVALAAKIDLRRRVLAEVPNARVLDAMCGRGEMHRAVWNQAPGYVGNDVRPWLPTDPPRYVADAERLLRCLDLQQFNVFDVDSHGDPWPALEIVLHRRTWSSGERGALVITDGATASAKFRSGQLTGPVQRIAGLSTAPRSSGGAGSIIELVVRRWMERAHVRPVASWKAHRPSNLGGRAGGVDVWYMAVVFDGQ